MLTRDWTSEDAYRATRLRHDQTRSPDQRPATVIFAHSDTISIGVLATLRDVGIRVPQDCSVIACDDLPIAACTAPPLTTVHLPFRQTRARAVEVLLARIVGTPVPVRTSLPTELVVRGSTGPARPSSAPKEAR